MLIYDPFISLKKEKEKKKGLAKVTKEPIFLKKI